MPPSSLLRYPPGLEPSPSSTPTLPQFNLPTPATRRAACTHLTMDRLYGSFRCNVCNRPSELGWVYVCTQDDKKPATTTGDAPPPASVDLNNHSVDLVGLENEIKYGSNPPESTMSALDQPSFIMPTNQLSPWIEKAISEGHYTADMISILRAQKQHVVDVTKTAIEDFDESQRTSSASTQTDTTSTSQSVDADPNSPYHHIHEVRGLPSNDTASNETLFMEPKLTMFPHCKFLACQICRPTFKDRVWQRFEDIFATRSQNLVSILESTYRPLASLSVMQNIGLRPTPRGRPRLRHFGSNGLYTFDAEGKAIFKNRPILGPALDIPESRDVADASTESESKGFKRNFKRTLRGMLASRTPTRSGRKRKIIKESTTEEEDAAEGDMGLWKESNDALLDEAVGVPLPMVEDGLAEGERMVEERDVAGVAVMEEAADLGEPDIIMSV